MKRSNWLLTISAAVLLAASSVSVAGGPGSRHSGYEGYGKGSVHHGH